MTGGLPSALNVSGSTRTRNVNPYVQAFQELPNLGYLDMGMESDLAKMKALFPETRRAVSVLAHEITGRAARRVEKRHEENLSGAGPLRCGDGRYSGNDARQTRE